MRHSTSTRISQNLRMLATSRSTFSPAAARIFLVAAFIWLMASTAAAQLVVMPAAWEMPRLRCGARAGQMDRVRIRHDAGAADAQRRRQIHCLGG